MIAGCGGKDSSHGLGKPAWTVRKQAGVCYADVKLDCPKDVSCNPPAPREIECPPGATESMIVTVVEKSENSCAIVPAGCEALSCAKQATPCPKPYVTAPPPDPLKGIWVVQRGSRSHDECEAFDDRACRVPAGQPAPPCNPPPPQVVACPPELGDQPALRIGSIGGAGCAIAPAPCEDTSCVKQAIECPHAPGGQPLPD